MRMNRSAKCVEELEMAEGRSGVGESFVQMKGHAIGGDVALVQHDARLVLCRGDHLSGQYSQPRQFATLHG